MPRLQKTTIIPQPRDQVFAFFGDAANLQSITPPELSFQIVTPLPIEMQVGTLIDYRLQLFGIPFAWRTLISSWDPPNGFVDEQIKGPYRLWRHQHDFVETAGGTEMTDRVDYQLPLWPFGELARPVVAGQLERIFSYRQKQILKLLV